MRGERQTDVTCGRASQGDGAPGRPDGRGRPDGAGSRPDGLGGGGWPGGGTGEGRRVLPSAAGRGLGSW